MRTYLDYAATSAVRPQAVVDAVTDFLTSCGATAGRGGHAGAVDAGRIAYRCRRTLMDLLGLSGAPGRVAFMHNATHALNTALRGLLGPGDAAVVSVFDHNAVLRPLHALERERGVSVRMMGGSREGEIDLDEAERLLEGARLLVVNDVSNVLGTRLPLADLAERARDAGALVLVDVAQSAGHVPCRLADHGADLVAFTGHKGLLAPQGTGGLWAREGIDVEPLLRGGTGGNSLSREMPEDWPDHLEAGTGNTPGLAGLLEGCRHLLENGVERVHERCSSLKKRLRDGLTDFAGVRVLSPAAPDGIGIVTMVSDRVDPSTLAERLDREFDVATRAGLHCAPEVHRMLGTTDSGALRLSLGWASTPEDVDHALEGIHHIVGRPVLPVA